jgi:TIR domain
MRNLLFIGHAAPEDNEFTIWLHSRLELEGYKVWCDLENLSGGERDFWTEIQRVIEHEAHKYLLVFSKHAFQKDGVIDEFEFSRSIAKKNILKDFVVPLKIDNVAYIDRIGINRYNVIDFSHSWIPGLRKLFKKLKIDATPKEREQECRISEKILDLYHNDSKFLIQHQERYYSNWWRIPQLPEKIFIFKYRDERSARLIIEEDAEYPVILHGNCLVAFEQNIKSICEKHGFIKIRFEDIHVIKIEDILKGYESDRFPTVADSRNFLKRLLKKAFKNLMYENGLLKFYLSNSQCFYRKMLFDQRKPTKIRYKIN